MPQPADMIRIQVRGERLRTARLARGLSVRDVAEALACHPSQVRNLENGHRRLDPAYAPALFRVLGLTLDDIAPGATAVERAAVRQAEQHEQLVGATS